MRSSVYVLTAAIWKNFGLAEVISSAAGSMMLQIAEVGQTARSCVGSELTEVVTTSGSKTGLA